ncbi:hypothetical protein [Nostoc sp.]|uniref:hypothetical protein n=1 Tax=Nostoc sp. TaxID=1180 RepID=UPI002FFB734B
MPYPSGSKLRAASRREVRTERSRHGQIPFNYEIGLNDFLTVPVMKLLPLEQK